MAHIQELCPRCRAAADVYEGQIADEGRLLWWISWLCPVCWYAVEEDGWDESPEEIRRAILEQEGIWALIVSEEGASVIRVMKVLRQALGLSLAEVSELRQRIPGEVVRGTRAEV